MIDTLRIVIIFAIITGLCIVIMPVISNLIKGEGIVQYIPVTITFLVFGFAFFSIYGYLFRKIILNRKTLEFSGVGAKKVIQFADISHIDYSGVSYRGFIKAMIYNLLFGRFTVHITLKDGSTYNCPSIGSSLFPSGFREVKAKELVEAVTASKEKL